MKKNSAFVFVLYFTSLSVLSAQASKGGDGRVNFLTSSDRFQYVNPFDTRSIETHGTRFFYDSLYHLGELRTTKQLYTTELQYRFDQIDRTVQVKTESGKVLWLDEKDVVYFKLFIADKEVYFVPASLAKGKKPKLLQVIYKSPTMQLLRDSRKYTIRVKSDNLDGYSSEEVYDEIRKDYRYYFSKGDDTPLKQVKPTASSFIDVMPDKKAQINKLFKAAKAKEGLSITKLSDILKELDKKEGVTE